jgi:hypothetical protein
VSAQYVKLDSNYWLDARLMDAGPLAEVLYVRAMCLAARLGIDGVLVDPQVQQCGLGIRKWRVHADKLVAVGLWERVDGGWRV